MTASLDRVDVLEYLAGQHRPGSYIAVNRGAARVLGTATDVLEQLAGELVDAGQLVPRPEWASVAGRRWAAYRLTDTGRAELAAQKSGEAGDSTRTPQHQERSASHGIASGDS